VRRSNATAQAGLYLGELAKVTIPLPPKQQQGAICSVLGTIDHAIERTEALIRKFTQIKAGLMHDLFTRGLDGNGQLRPTREDAPELYKDSPLGWIPVCWSISSIQRVSTLIVDCPHSTPVLSAEGYAMVRTSEIEDGIFLSDEAPTVSEIEWRARNVRAVPRTGDIVFTREAPVGENFVVPDGSRICLGQRLMLLRPNSAICRPSFLSHQLYTAHVKREFDRITGGTTNPHINVSDVRNFLIALPHIDEQIEMETLLGAINDRLLNEKTSWQKLQCQKLGLMQDLLTGSESVKINKLVHEPTHV
jgi:type I restriction enzyme S subunit